MENILIVALVSEQTIPNVQFLKWFYTKEQKTVDVLFVSTNQMEKVKKAECIKEAVNFEAKIINKSSVIEVNANSLHDTQSKLKSALNKIENTRIVFNITGGTKLMSIAAYELAKEMESCEIFYQPIKSDLQQLFPNYEKFPVNETVSLKETFIANGIEYSMSNDCVKNYDFNKDVYERLIEPNRDILTSIVCLQSQQWIKDLYKKNGVLDFTKIDDNDYLKNKLSKLNTANVCRLLSDFDFDPKSISAKEIFYLAGGWYEEYVYQKILETYNIEKKNIALNVSIKTGNDLNELDVVFVDRNNVLRIIECKSFAEGSKVKMFYMQHFQNFKP